MARRRKRYTAICAPRDGGPARRVDALAYSRKDAAAAYEHHGLVPGGITLKKPEPPKLLPPRKWALDRAAIRVLCEREEVTWPVEIKRTINGHDLGGRHRLRRNNGVVRHVITVSSGATVAEAEEVVRHEVRHARQAEEAARARGGDPIEAWERFKRVEDRRHGTARKYRQRPREANAREAEKQNTDLKLIID